MSGDPRMRESARRALGERSPGERNAERSAGGERSAERSAEASIERVTLDARIDDRVEAVTLMLRDGELTWSSTDGTAGRESAGSPVSPFVRSALRWLAAGAGVGEVLPRGSDPGRSLRPPPPSVDDAASQLASALDDAVTAVARAGTIGRDSPTVRDALDRVVQAVTPARGALARWIGRLERALSSGDAPLVARLLDGAARGADDLREAGPGARARGAAWLGTLASGNGERAVDRAMIEVARETLDGVQRAGIERRYLVDVTSGEVLREERARGEPAPSIGPCPRWVVVGLAELEEGAAPRRVKLLQYTVSLDVPAGELERVHANATRRTTSMVEAYRAAITASPALAEPVQVIAVAAIEDGILVDAAGDAIPIARDEDPGAAAALDRATAAGDVEWIVGRVIDVDGAVRVIPCSFARRGKVIRLR